MNKPKYKQLYKDQISQTEFYKTELVKLTKEKEESKTNKRYEEVVYCKNCMKVNKVSIYPGIPIGATDCVNCRVRGSLYIVVE